MKSVIYYFTGTGNNLEVAKKISEVLPDCKLVSMGKGCHDSGEVYDNVGFVHPTYAFNIPRRVAEFLSESSFEKSKNTYFFAVSGCGNVNVYHIPFEQAVDKDAPDYKERRTIAKNCNFGTFFGLSPKGLQKTLKFEAGLPTPLSECEGIINNLKSGYTGLNRWQEAFLPHKYINFIHISSLTCKNYLFLTPYVS